MPKYFISKYVRGNPISTVRDNFTISDLEMKRLVQELGPVVVSIDSNNGAFKNSKSIIDANRYSKNPDHAVVIVGWNQENGTEYWIVKNSWGPSFGFDGFFKVRTGFNVLGINTYSFVPIG